MTSKFFITGLPRSRTAWFAAFMTQGNTFCWHEALNGCLSKQDFYDRMELPYEHVGNSDMGLPLTDFQKRWPDAPTLIIWRDPQYVLDSLAAATEMQVNHEVLNEVWHKMDRLKGIHIAFGEIDERLPEIHKYLTGVDVDPRRVELFKRMNIQLKELTTNPASLAVWE